MPEAATPSLDLAHNSLLRTIAEQDRSLHAWVFLCEPPRRDLHESAGVLGDHPFGVKDVIDVAGMPTRCGSPATPAAPATADASCVALLRSAGALPIGKTATAEFAHVTPGPTRNPANPAHTPGGSSSGSAAAVAAGMVPFALGTQTGGSMVRPAAYCGVVGFKPSFGTVPREGMRVMCPSLDVIGWHSVDVRVAHQIAEVLLPESVRGVGQPRPPRIGFMQEHPGHTLEAACSLALLQAVSDLDHCGHELAPADPPPQAMRLLEAHGIITHYELGRSLRALGSSSRRLLSPALREAIDRGLACPEASYTQAMRLREQAAGSWDSCFGEVDLVLTSSVPGPAPAGLSHTGPSGFNKAWSLLGWPCIHLPTSTDEQGLPLGVLLVARPGLDRALLHWAEALHPLMDRRSPANPT